MIGRVLSWEGGSYWMVFLWLMNLRKRLEGRRGNAYSRVLYSKGLMARGSNCPILIPHHSGRP